MNIKIREIISWLTYTLDKLEIFAPDAFHNDDTILGIQRKVTDMEAENPLDFLEKPEKIED